MIKPPKTPRDPNQLAKLITDIATGEASGSDNCKAAPENPPPKKKV